MISSILYRSVGLLWLLLLSVVCVYASPTKPPLGTVYLDSNLYIDQQPVRVIDYLEFLHDIRKGYQPKVIDSINKLPLFGLNENEALSVLLPNKFDSLFYDRMLLKTWQVLSSDRKVLGIDNQIMGNKYYNFPVVNVGYYQMIEFCRWRTAKVKLHYAVNSMSLKQRQKYPIDFQFRIIKRSEWEKAMAIYFENVVKLEAKNDAEIGVNDPAPYPDRSQNYFAYISENVGEYLADDIVSTGLNWNTKYGIGDVRYVYYNNPTDWVGFRCICEVKNAPIVVEQPVKKPKEKEKPAQKVEEEPKAKKLKGIKSEDVKRKKK